MIFSYKVGSVNMVNAVLEEKKYRFAERLNGFSSAENIITRTAVSSLEEIEIGSQSITILELK